MLAPPLKLLGGGAAPPLAPALPTPMFYYRLNCSFALTLVQSYYERTFSLKLNIANSVSLFSILFSEFL